MDRARPAVCWRSKTWSGSRNTPTCGCCQWATQWSPSPIATTTRCVTPLSVTTFAMRSDMSIWNKLDAGMTDLYMDYQKVLRVGRHKARNVKAVARLENPKVQLALHYADDLAPIEA